MAVYTEVDDEQLAAFLTRFDVGELMSFRGIAEGVENSNYIVATTAHQFILTLYEKRVAPEDLPFFLGLMEHLAAKGLSCPTPLRDRDGNNLGELAGRPAALVTFLEGIWPRRPSPDHCRAVGAEMARMHLAGQDFALKRVNALGADGWSSLYARFAAQADEIYEGLQATIAAELDTLLPAWPRDLPEGVIHADLFPDNVFFRAGELSGLIDFYFACNDALAYDIAIALNAWCFETNYAYNLTKGRALIAGYQSVRPLSDREAECLPILARGAALRFLLTRAYDWIHTPPNAFVKPHDPLAYLRRIWVHRAMESAQDYGWQAKAGGA